MTRTSAPRRRRALSALVASALLAGLLSATAPASAKNDELHQARVELRQTKARIRARMAKMRETQRNLNHLATAIAQERAIIDRAADKIQALEATTDELLARLAELKQQLADRAREAYITASTAAPMLYLLSASSPEEAVSRVTFLDEMNRRDAVLATQVQAVRTRIAERRADVRSYRALQQVTLAQLQSDRDALRRALLRSRDLYASLRLQKQEIIDHISRIRPFAACPVAGPHAIADAFGIWVHRDKKWGGDHVHQGDDISAAMGTPIVAPFDGTAVVATNHIGGLAVKVYGVYGYVYNAHLSGFGQLGHVTTGTVIGYVGATGDAGGPHDHFEWHPGNGPAVDPYPYLLLVC